MTPTMRGDVPTTWAGDPDSWWAHVASCPYCSRFYAQRKPYCDRCDGTDWIAVEDPILGGLIDYRCPDCNR